MGSAGVVVAILATSAQASALDGSRDSVDEADFFPTKDSDIAIATVIQAGAISTGVKLEVGDRQIEAKAYGFPADWQSAVGDVLVVDLRGPVVWPHVRSELAADKRSRTLFSVSSDGDERTMFEMDTQ